MSSNIQDSAKRKGLRVTAHMRIFEVIALFPQAVDILQEYGLHCFACDLGGRETLEEGCKTHGMEEELIEELIDDINCAIAEAPAGDRILTVTPEASRGIAEIVEAEGKDGQVLRVVVDEQGGFCLEFAEEPEEFDSVFFHEEYPDVCVCASPLALRRIGGGKVDMRDGRFKLDLPDQNCGCGCKESCDCVN